MFKYMVLLITLKTVFASPTGDSLLNRIPASHVPKWDLMVTPDGKTYLVDANPLDNDLEVSTRFTARSDVKFLLYTRQNPNTYHLLKLDTPDSVRNSYFNPSKPCRYIIHGWNSDANSGVNIEVRQAYLQREDVNVIVVDWSAGANNLIYSISRARINSVADTVAEMIDWLATDFGAPVSNVYVVGHSLGGHTAGLVGKRVKQGRLPVIVAFDPAGPEFSINKPSERLEPTDADFVEVIHTNAGLLGFTEPIGDVDLYPNGGKSQPGCTLDVAGSCAHSRSYKYFAESLISSSGFKSLRCGNHQEILKGQCNHDGTIVYMGGEPIFRKESGSYYLTTSKKSPFAEL